MREIPAAAQDEIRRRAIAALNSGVKQVEVARVMSLPERTIRRWVAQMKREGGTTIEPKRRGRKAGEAAALNVRRMKRIESIVLGKMPDQLRLPFYLWTREAVGALIEREYGITLSAASIGNYLKRWGMSPQKPVRRAYERDAAAIQRWIETDYPAIAADAKRRRAQRRRAGQKLCPQRSHPGDSNDGPALWLQHDFRSEQPGGARLSGV